MAAVAALAFAACNQAAATPDVAKAPRLVEIPVGPLPGPVMDELQGPPNPFAGDEQSLAMGRRYFTSYNCAGCHGDHGGGGMGPSLRDEVWLYGSSDGHIANSIAQGRAFGMPSWRARLTDAQIWQIAAYLKSMRTTNEPDAPQ